MKRTNYTKRKASVIIHIYAKLQKKKQLCTYTYKCPSKKSKDDFKRGKCKYTYKCYPKKNKQLCKYTYKQCKPAKLINGNKKLSFKPYHYMVTER